jgi:hypothetical protein
LFLSFSSSLMASNLFKPKSRWCVINSMHHILFFSKLWTHSIIWSVTGFYARFDPLSRLLRLSNVIDNKIRKDAIFFVFGLSLSISTLMWWPAKVCSWQLVSGWRPSYPLQSDKTSNLNYHNFFKQNNHYRFFSSAILSFVFCSSYGGIWMFPCFNKKVYYLKILTLTQLLVLVLQL